MPAPQRAVQLAAKVLERHYADGIRSPIAPRGIREAVFTLASSGLSSHSVWEQASNALKIPAPELREALFADLPRERRLLSPPTRLSPAALSLEVNHLMISLLLRRATQVKISVEGNARALLRTAKLRGLIVVATPASRRDGIVLQMSGPFSLFRHTLVYGRALASLLSRAAHCHRFELQANCCIPGLHHPAVLRVQSGDPIMPAPELAAYDSRVEARFVRDFAKIALDWDIVREPAPISIASVSAAASAGASASTAAKPSFLFPDFLLRHRRDPRRAVLMEIVGYWTPDYLASKLEKLKQVPKQQFIVCVDESLNCSDQALPAGAKVIRFRRRVPASEVLAAAQALTTSRRG